MTPSNLNLDSNLFKKLGVDPVQLYIGVAVFTLVPLFLGIILEQYFLFLIPLAVAFIIFCILDFKKLYLLLLFFIPLSMEVNVPGGFSTDLPAEPLMILLMGIYFLYITTNRDKINWDFVKHPIIQVLIIHIVWIFISALYAEIKLIAIKFFLAKLWYVSVFVFLTGLIIKTKEDFKQALLFICIPLVYTILASLVKHASLGFSFDDVNRSLVPFFRNHVNYAALLSLLLPFIWMAPKWHSNKNAIRFFKVARVVVILGLVFAYTRGAWLSLIMAGIFIFVLKRKWIGKSIIAGVIVLIGTGFYMVKNNQYLDHAPDFSTTIYHADLGEHLSATTEFKDVSGAERIYRWVASIKMSGEHLLTGFGPNNFYHYYKSHTVSMFSTYVSDNPEKSGTHNYFLMTLTEQGIIGLLLFILLTFFIFRNGAMLYHECKDKEQKEFVLVILTSMLIIYVQLMLSDLVEALKIGVFFFFNVALLVNQDLLHKKKKI